MGRPVLPRFEQVACQLGLAVSLLWPVGCAEADNRAPTLDFLGNQSIQVSDGLRLPLTGSDPDGDVLTFTVSGLPDSAEVVPSTASEALLYWNPLASDTEPGGKTYDVTITVDDGRGGSSSAQFALTVYAESGEPTFDLPAGIVVNLATDDDLALIVGVKDVDSVDVAVALVEGPDGAKLQSAGPKSAYFHWQPTEEQRKIVVHRAVFAAQDEIHGAVTHELTIVLLNAEDAAGCDGTPPTVKHLVAGDSVLAAPAVLDLAAEVVDGESAISSVRVEWQLDTVDSAQEPSVTTMAVPDGGAAFEASLDLGTLPDGGALLHYAIIARDNDDATGSGCDRETRSPKSGWHTVAVYPDTGPAGACVDDAGEPDSTRGTAPGLAPGLYPGRRICGQDKDYARIEASPVAFVTASVLRQPEHGQVIVRLLDAQGTAVDTADDAAAPSLTVTAGGAGPYTVEVEGTGPKPQLSYMLLLTAEEAACEADLWEPNDGVAEATTDVGDGVLTGPLICPGDVDWFRLNAAAGEVVTVVAAFEHAYGDLDLELLASDGTTVIAASSGQTSSETVAYDANVSGAGTFYVRVFGHEGVGNGYTLSVTREQAGVTCDEDLLEGNLSWGSAAALFQGVYQNLTACPGAPDWFRLEVNGGETVSVLVEASAGDDVRVRIYDDPTDSALTTATPDAAGLVLASVVIDTPGPVFYEVESLGGLPVDYNLLQDLEDPAGACLDDRYEPNDTPEEAPVLEPGIHTWLRLCDMEDDDHFRVLDVPPFATLEILTSHAFTGGYTDIVVTNPNGEVIADVLDLGSGADASILAELPGTYRLHVKPFDVEAALPYDLAVLVD